MILLKSAADLSRFVNKNREKGHSIGFVPTMGALHQGHISLIEQSRKECTLTICSIFVNPTQFNNPEDFKKYPVTIEKDIDMLEKWGCDVLFLPEAAEIYPPGFIKPHYELGYLETLLEGKYRPGHFQGVCQVVDRLLEIVMPDKLYLGQKDYQQCMVLTKLVKDKYDDTTIVICPTLRETDGLAMSSRNLRLNEDQRKIAIEIYNSLLYIKQHIKSGQLETLTATAIKKLTAHGFKVDYVAIADAETLSPIDKWNGQQQLVALLAAFLDDIRLIDNMVLN
ncbi:MAG: pantoate--beta-alanine ligase [Ferruginibacter sp.]